MICLLCLPLLAILTSPKSNVSMVSWLADCRFDLDYRIAWRVRTKISRTKKASCYKHGCFVHAQLQLIAANLTLSFDKQTTKTVNLWSTPHLSLSLVPRLLDGLRGWLLEGLVRIACACVRFRKAQVKNRKTPPSPCLYKFMH